MKTTGKTQIDLGFKLAKWFKDTITLINEK